MSGSKDHLFSIQPKIIPSLDRNFQPIALANHQYRQLLAGAPKPERVIIALERNGGFVQQVALNVLPSNPETDAQTFRYVERTVKSMIWIWGGWKLYLAGPHWLCKQIEDCYRGSRAFDANLMARAYSCPFEIAQVTEGELPPVKTSSLKVGGHLEGCRIGFDLGASDYKVAAVQDGKPIYSAEFPWNPKDQPDPRYHYDHINAGLRAAAAHLPRVDAIGGSSAGIIVDNEVRVASLFRSVPQDKFDTQVRPLFHRLGREWGVPLQVINDGDVTALAGALSLQLHAMLGIAMGSSQAAGFLDREGRVTGWLNELAFAPVDVNPSAAADEWSGDLGVGALYFSQQAVNKLATPAGFNFEKDMDLPNRLKMIQQKLADGDPNARKIFETIGVYLGYSLPLYREFLDFENVLVLGRVTSGEAGEIMLAQAKSVLDAEFPEEARRIQLFLPDEKSKRVGQAVAAASLPQTSSH